MDWHALDNASKEEKKMLAELAIGRLFSILSRPFREGDHEEYAKVRSVLLHVSPEDHRRFFPLGDPRGGAQGD